MAIKSELGQDGFDLWDQWSQVSDSYRAKDARDVWKSFRGGGISIGSLYHEAIQHGWTAGHDLAIHEDVEAIRARHIRVQAEAKDAERQRAMRAKAGAKLAVKLLVECAFEPHIYLDSKGFGADERGGMGMVHPCGDLMIPMRDCQTNQIINAQRIAPDGAKKFLPGARAKGGVHRLGGGNELWLCEGYATGLSVLEGLRALHRTATALVCFSAGNLVEVAQMIKGRRFVVADHDESGTGETAARKTGLPWVMPDMIGDANDLHQTKGIRAVAALLRRGLQP